MDAFLYTLSAFGLIALICVLGFAGAIVGGEIGLMIGVAVGCFILIWAACYFLD